MKKFILFTCYILNLSAVAQQWDWAKNISYTFTNSTGVCLAADNNSNFYLSANSTSSGGSCLARFNIQGNELWRQYFTNLTGGLTIKGVSCSANYVYITGTFSGTLQIGTNNLASNGGQDIFIACFTPNGNFVWANNYGGPKDDFGNGICTDANGNIYLTGSYADTAHFGTSNLICQCSSTMYNSSNMFMAKLDPSGNILLLKSAGQLDTLAYGSKGTKIKTDAAGNIFIQGGCNDMVLDTFHMGGHTYFICKLDSSGWTQWVKQAGDDYDPYFNLDPDQNGNVITTGIQLQNHGGCRSSTKKYSSSGLLMWEVALGGGYYDSWILNDIATNGVNSFVVGSSYIDSSSRHYFLVGEYDPTGLVIALDTVYSNASGESIIRDSNGDFIVCGNMIGALKLGNDSLNTVSHELFIAKFKASISVGISENSQIVKETWIYPNPSSGIFTVNLQNTNATTMISIFDLLGNCLWNEAGLNDGSTRIDLSGQPKGIYLIEIRTKGQKVVKKIVIQ